MAYLWMWMTTVTCLRPCSMETILVRTHYDVVWQRLVEDITWGRAVVLRKLAAEFVSHLRISPLGISSFKEKLRVILDLSFRKGGAVDEYIGVNGDTAFEKASKSETGGVMPAFATHLCPAGGRRPRCPYLYFKNGCQGCL